MKISTQKNELKRLPIISPDQKKILPKSAPSGLKLNGIYCRNYIKLITNHPQIFQLRSSHNQSNLKCRQNSIQLNKNVEKNPIIDLNFSLENKIHNKINHLPYKSRLQMILQQFLYLRNQKICEKSIWSIKKINEQQIKNSQELFLKINEQQDISFSNKEQQYSFEKEQYIQVFIKISLQLIVTIGLNKNYKLIIKYSQKCQVSILIQDKMQDYNSNSDINTQNGSSGIHSKQNMSLKNLFSNYFESKLDGNSVLESSDNFNITFKPKQINQFFQNSQLTKYNDTQIDSQDKIQSFCTPNPKQNTFSRLTEKVQRSDRYQSPFCINADNSLINRFPREVFTPNLLKKIIL